MAVGANLTPALRPELQDKPRNLLHRETGGLGWGSQSAVRIPGLTPSKDRLFDLSHCRIHECKHPAPVHQNQAIKGISGSNCKPGALDAKPRLGPKGKLLSRGDIGLEHSNRKAWRQCLSSKVSAKGYSQPLDVCLIRSLPQATNY